MSPSLADRAWYLLTTALRMYRDNAEAADWLRHQMDRFEGALRIAVTGPAHSGKSTLINALVGDEVAPTGTGFVWYQDGPTPRTASSSPPTTPHSTSRITPQAAHSARSGAAIRRFSPSGSAEPSNMWL